jgi:hypothetical protein
VGGAVVLGVFSVGLFPALLYFGIDFGALSDFLMPLTGIAGFLIGLPTSILLARDALMLRGALRRDLRKGQVVVFGEGDEERVALPESGVILARGGAPCFSTRRVVIADASATPEMDRALITEELIEVTTQTVWNERPLSLEERSEIRDRALRFGRIHWLLWVWTLLAVFGLALFLARGERRIPAWIGTLAILVWIWKGRLTDRRTRRRLNEDARRGVVMRATTGEHEGVEVLPCSMLVWTKAGIPAPWRMAPAVAASRRLRGLPTSGGGASP